jgi:hypothetical protein
MPRVYSVSVEGVAVSAVQDLLQIKGATGKMLRILKVKWANTDTSPLAAVQMLQTRCRFLPATVTDGNGTSTGTPRPYDPGDAGAIFTFISNSTTKASTTGTATILMESGDHIQAGLDYPFRNPPIIGPSQSFTFELITAPNGTVHLSVMADVEESGG